MVVFTCNSCGDSLQKPKVAKHFQFQCRNPIFITCIDCHKDFRDDEYTAHTKCITENERYGGADYVPKASANKGERKQQAWITIVQDVLANDKTLTPPEKNFLNSISRHENIPRKKAKFINFVKSACGYRANMSVAESVWGKMESAFKNSNSTEKKEESNISSVSTNGVNSEHNVTENENNENICKENGNDAEGGKPKKEKKKRTKETEDLKEQPAKKKKKQSVEPANEVAEETKEIPKPVEEADEDKTVLTTQNGNDDKFSWKSAVTEIVTSKGEISMKKLKKKVISQYLARFPDVTNEKATARFEKKLAKMSTIVVSEDKVRIC